MKTVAEIYARLDGLRLGAVPYQYREGPGWDRRFRELCRAQVVLILLDIIDWWRGTMGRLPVTSVGLQACDLAEAAMEPLRRDEIDTVEAAALLTRAWKQLVTEDAIPAGLSRPALLALIHRIAWLRLLVRVLLKRAWSTEGVAPPRRIKAGDKNDEEVFVWMALGAMQANKCPLVPDADEIRQMVFDEDREEDLLGRLTLLSLSSSGALEPHRAALNEALGGTMAAVAGQARSERGRRYSDTDS